MDSRHQPKLLGVQGTLAIQNTVSKNPVYFIYSAQKNKNDNNPAIKSNFPLFQKNNVLQDFQKYDLIMLSTINVDKQHCTKQIILDSLIAIWKSVLKYILAYGCWLNNFIVKTLIWYWYYLLYYESSTIQETFSYYKLQVLKNTIFYQLKWYLQLGPFM